MTDSQNTHGQITSDRRSKHAWSNCILCIPFILNGSQLKTNHAFSAFVSITLNLIKKSILTEWLLARRKVVLTRALLSNQVLQSWSKLELVACKRSQKESIDWRSKHLVSALWIFCWVLSSLVFAFNLYLASIEFLKSLPKCCSASETMKCLEINLT